MESQMIWETSGVGNLWSPLGRTGQMEENGGVPMKTNIKKNDKVFQIKPIHFFVCLYKNEFVKSIAILLDLLSTLQESKRDPFQVQPPTWETNSQLQNTTESLL